MPRNVSSRPATADPPTDDSYRARRGQGGRDNPPFRSMNRLRYNSVPRSMSIATLK